MTIVPQCFDCKRWRENDVCVAFPDRIPDEILLNLHDHKQPYPGDGGIRFESNERPRISTAAGVKDESLIPLPEK